MNYRNTFIISVSVLLLSTALWIWVDLYSKGNKIRQQEKELAIVEKKFKALAEVQDSYDIVKAHHATVVSSFDTLKLHIVPNQERYISLLERIRSLAEQQNVRIITLSPQREDSFPIIKQGLKFTGKHVVRYPVQIRLIGDFLTIGVFLEELMSLPVTVNIGRISIETELELGGLACELVLYTYMFKNKV